MRRQMKKKTKKKMLPETMMKKATGPTRKSKRPVLKRKSIPKQTLMTKKKSKIQPPKMTTKQKQKQKWKQRVRKRQQRKPVVKKT